MNYLMSLAFFFLYKLMCIPLNKLHNFIFRKKRTVGKLIFFIWKSLFVLPRSMKTNVAKLVDQYPPMRSTSLLLSIQFIIKIKKNGNYTVHTPRAVMKYFLSSAGMCKQSNCFFQTNLFLLLKRHRKKLFI
jgi:hypothetical protein